MGRERIVGFLRTSLRAARLFRPPGSNKEIKFGGPFIQGPTRYYFAAQKARPSFAPDARIGAGIAWARAKGRSCPGWPYRRYLLALPASLGLCTCSAHRSFSARSRPGRARPGRPVSRLELGRKERPGHWSGPDCWSVGAATPGPKSRWPPAGMTGSRLLLSSSGTGWLLSTAPLVPRPWLIWRWNCDACAVRPVRRAGVGRRRAEELVHGDRLGGLRLRRCLGRYRLRQGLLDGSSRGRLAHRSRSRSNAARGRSRASAPAAQCPSAWSAA